LFGIAATMAQVHAWGVLHWHLTANHMLLDDHFEIRVPSFWGAEFVEEYHIATAARCLGPEYEALALRMGYRDGSLAFTADVWAYGILIYRTFTSEFELDGMRFGPSMGSRMRAVAAGARLKRHDGIPDKWWEAIDCCWREDPRARPTFDEIVSVLMTDDSMALPGTDMAAYKEYRTRVSLQGEQKCKRPAPASWRIRQRWGRVGCMGRHPGSCPRRSPRLRVSGLGERVHADPCVILTDTFRRRPARDRSPSCRIALAPSRPGAVRSPGAST